MDVRVIHALTGAGLIPVIAPGGRWARDGQTYNINADTARAGRGRQVRWGQSGC